MKRRPMLNVDTTDIILSGHNLPERGRELLAAAIELNEKKLQLLDAGAPLDAVNIVLDEEIDTLLRLSHFTGLSPAETHEWMRSKRTPERYAR